MIAKTVTAVALLASAATVKAGTWTFQNACQKQQTYFTVVQAKQAGQAAGISDGPHQVVNGQTSSAQQFIQLATGGVSIKMSDDTSLANITQFEYSYYGDGVSNWYDMSNINGNIFPEGGMMLYPVTTTAGNCHGVTCCAGSSDCSSVYNVWDDDKKVGPNNPMGDCLGSSDLAFVACPNLAGGNVAELYSSACPGGKAAATGGAGSSGAPPASSGAAAPPASTPSVGNPPAASPPAANPPAASSQGGNSKVVPATKVTQAVETTSQPFVMEVETVTVMTTEYGRAEPTPDARVKRHLHRHAHAHDF